MGYEEDMAAHKELELRIKIEKLEKEKADLISRLQKLTRYEYKSQFYQGEDESGMKLDEDGEWVDWYVIQELVKEFQK